jgi:hypothetical protein
LGYGYGAYDYPDYAYGYGDPGSYGYGAYGIPAIAMVAPVMGSTMRSQV